MFKFHLDQAFELERIPYVILLGIFCGLVSLYFTRRKQVSYRDY